ncbi:MAG: lysylphosphatidylglycerol synthase domain-containing protein, partial [Nitrosopumilaceae archaeon]
SWVAILDIVTEVFAGGLLAIMAGILALMSGAIIIAAIVLSTSVFVTTLWMILFFLSSKKTFQVPTWISNLIQKFGKDKGGHIIDQTNQWMEEICSMSRKNFGTKESKKVFVNGFILSIISWIFYGTSFMIIANETGYVIDLFDSVMAVMGANAIGNLPITVGGSGLAEFGIVAYLNNSDPFNFEIPQKSIEWSAVIGWRIATYYVPIVVTWLLLVKLALSKYTKPNIS